MVLCKIETLSDFSNNYALKAVDDVGLYRAIINAYDWGQTLQQSRSGNHISVAKFGRRGYVDL
jgi:hypothetical protein